MKVAIVSSAKLTAQKNWTAEYWIRRIKQQEEVNRILHLIGEPEEELDGKLLRSQEERA